MLTWASQPYENDTISWAAPPAHHVNSYLPAVPWVPPNLWVDYEEDHHLHDTPPPNLPPQQLDSDDNHQSQSHVCAIVHSVMTDFHW